MGERKDNKEFMKKVCCARGVENFKPFQNRNYHEGHHFDLELIRITGLREPLTNEGFLSFALIPPEIYHRHIKKFYVFYHFDSDNLTLNFQMYGINSIGIMIYTDATETREFIKYRMYHSSKANRINTVEVQNAIFKPEYQCNDEADLHWAQSNLCDTLYAWEHVLTSNVFVKLGARGNVSIVVG